MRPDLCVIGGGTAGHALALAAAAMGARCTVVDPRERLGRGQAADLAESMLIHAAHAHARRGAPFDWHEHRQRLGRALAGLAPNHGAERLRTLGVTVIRAQACFDDGRTVVADGAAIRARRFILAAGGRPAPPPWATALGPGRMLQPARLAALPTRIAVVAETPDGYAWAQALARLGANVTLVAAPGAEAPFDRELIEPVVAALRRDGVTLFLDHTVASALDTQAGLQLSIRPAARDGSALSPSIEVTHVMHAGRPTPTVAALGLDRAGIACAEGGGPAVDAGLRTRNRRVLAIGDVLGAAHPGGAAIPYQVGLALRAALLRQPVRYRPDHVPVILRTAPALAQVGSMAPLSSDRARRVLRWPLSDTTDGLATGAVGGGVKIATTTGGRVRGAALAGQSAEEAIVPWVLAVAHNVPLSAIAGLPTPAAALAEASRRAGLSLLTARLGSPGVKRFLALLRLLP